MSEDIGDLIEPTYIGNERPFSLPDFRIESRTCLDESSAESSPVFHCAFHPTLPVLACGLHSGVIQTFRGSSTTAPFSEWVPENWYQVDVDSRINRLAWNVNGTKLAAGCFDGTVALWKLNDGTEAELIFQVREHELAVFDIAWNQWNRHWFATRSREEGDVQVIVMWSSRRDKSLDVQNLHLNSKFVWDMEWISSTRLAVCTFEGTILIYNIERRVPVKRLYHSGVCILRWHFALHYLVSCSIDGSIKVWSKKRYKDVEQIQLNSRIYCVDCHGIRSGGNSALIASGLEDGTIVIWHVTHNRWQTLEGHPDAVTRISFSPDGNFLATLDTEEKLIIWSTKNWAKVFEHVKQTNLDWDHLMWSFSGNKLAISSNQIKIIELTEIDLDNDNSL